MIAAAGRAGLKEGAALDASVLLVKKGFLKSEMKDSLLGLQKLRNLALFGAPGKTTAKEAREYVVMAEAAMWCLEENLKRNGESN